MTERVRTVEPRLAVLIDADNSSAEWAKVIFREIAILGEASVRRVYGDFSGTRLGSWRKVLANHALIPHQQPAYTRGKNSSDIALAIDAMDLLHSGRFHGFVLVSSDSDFTRLASRIREQGLDVFGIGKSTTPEAFRKACKRFIYIENLLDEDGEESVAPGKGSKKQPPSPKADASELGGDANAGVRPAEKIRQPPSKAVPLILAAMRKEDEDWVPLSTIGDHIHAAAPDFDSRTYGCPNLSSLVEKTGQFEVQRENPVAVRRKPQNQTAKRPIEP